ncbi:MAG: ArsB/NhaD family transporter [Candidatus Hydrogenedentes bacterium]|nr:ArsB/NhaD family transporter [Candidatus Hydrogenedentota bacterium]
MDFSAYLAIAIFLITYVLIISEKVHKTAAALAGGCAMILCGVVKEEEALAAVDLEVIFLLCGMMIIVHFLAESGFFRYLAIRLAQMARGRPVPLLLLLCSGTAVLSAMVDNVTTVLLVAPVTFLITAAMGVSPIPYLIFEALASNVGGTATLIGDPPNILIASATGLTFNDFLFNLTPVAAVCLIFTLGAAVWAIRGEARVTADLRARIMEMDAPKAITDRKMLIKSTAVLGAVLAGFLMHGLLGVKPASIALSGATALLVLTRAAPSKVFKAVEWPTLFFFIGLFMVISGLVSTGVLERVAQGVLSLTGNSLLLTCMMVLWFGAIASALVDNIPLTVTLIPVIKDIIPAIAASTNTSVATVEAGLWWSLALGVCLGGNGTIVGASANVVVVEIARTNGREITFRQFLWYGLPVMLTTIVICSVYVFLRYIF